MNTAEIVSLLLNFLLSSGLIFYASKRRKAAAEAGNAENVTESVAIANMRSSMVEWKELAETREDKLNKKDALIDRLYVEKVEERQKLHNAMLENTDLKLKTQALEFRLCNRRGCEGREPQTGF